MENWNITIKAPTGEFDATLTLGDEGGVPVGEMAGKNGKGPMQDLELSPAAIAWSTKVERPMPMKLESTRWVVERKLHRSDRDFLHVSNLTSKSRSLSPLHVSLSVSR